MYFLRLTKIKPAVDRAAAEAWDGTVIAGESAKRVDRVLDVRAGEFCYVSGTVYMEMPLKPNILTDVSKDRWIAAPVAVDKYFSDEDQGQIMLEDESGRIRLAGDVLRTVSLVTGCIIAVLGTENADGELEVIDVKFPDLAPQPERWSLTKAGAANGKTSKDKGKAKDEDEDEDMADGKPGGKKIAIVSGLSFSGTDASNALELDLLSEFLLGEALGPGEQQESAQISRLIIAGDSIAAAEKKLEVEEAALGKKATSKKYGYDAAAYNALPSQLLDGFLAGLLPSVPVTLLPGTHDPSNASFPQQPIHPAMFPAARAFAKEPSADEPGCFDAVTNPWEGEVEGWRVLGTGGQNVDDVFKYVDSNDRLGMMEAMCRWRCSAPTAPDTLCKSPNTLLPFLPDGVLRKLTRISGSYPFQDDDPFVMKNAPHLYFVGNQPEFGTRVIHGPSDEAVRLIAVPSFSETKEIVLVDTETLEVSKMRIATG